jgi:hypothetical protein
MTVVGLIVGSFALVACSYVVPGNTDEFESKIEALTERLARLESKDTTAVVASMKADLEAHDQQIRQIARQLAAATPRPEPRHQMVQVAPPPRATEDPQPTDTSARPRAGDRNVKRAQAVGTKAGLDEGQTARLASILEAQQERMALAAKSIRDQKLPKEQAAEQRKTAKQLNDALIEEFKATLTEDQSAKVDEALRIHKRTEGRKKEGNARPAREGKKNRDGKKQDRPKRKKKDKGADGQVDEDL